MCQILHPFIFSKMQKYPRKFPNFVNTGTRIHNYDWPVKIVSTKCSKRNCKAPHAYCKTVHIKQSIAACTEDSVDRHIIDGTADHVKSDHGKHTFQVGRRLLSGSFCFFGASVKSRSESSSFTPCARKKSAVTSV